MGVTRAELQRRVPRTSHSDQHNKNMGRKPGLGNRIRRHGGNICEKRYPMQKKRKYREGKDMKLAEIKSDRDGEAKNMKCPIESTAEAGKQGKKGKEKRQKNKDTDEDKKCLSRSCVVGEFIPF